MIRSASIELYEGKILDGRNRSLERR